MGDKEKAKTKKAKFNHSNQLKCESSLVRISPEKNAEDRHSNEIEGTSNSLCIDGAASLLAALSNNVPDQNTEAGEDTKKPSTTIIKCERCSKVLKSRTALRYHVNKGPCAIDKLQEKLERHEKLINERRLKASSTRRPIMKKSNVSSTAGDATSDSINSSSSGLLDKWGLISWIDNGINEGKKSLNDIFQIKCKELAFKELKSGLWKWKSFSSNSTNRTGNASSLNIPNRPNSIMSISEWASSLSVELSETAFLVHHKSVSSNNSESKKSI
jgi:uncharacterized C2H2 Zn-finger protein